MATLRLGDAERSSIREAFNRVINRAQFNQSFPLEPDDLEEFGLSLLPTEVRKRYSYLREYAASLTTESSWNPDFRIRSTLHEYDITLYHSELPRNKMMVEDGHQWHTEILEWAVQYCEVQDRISDASYCVSGIVAACSSVGQIKRIMQDEILRFVPEYMQDTLGNAERKSRIPRGYEMEPEKLELLADVLALGSLSPEKESGITTGVNRTPI